VRQAAAAARVQPGVAARGPAQVPAATQVPAAQMPAAQVRAAQVRAAQARLRRAVAQRQQRRRGELQQVANVVVRPERQLARARLRTHAPNLIRGATAAEPMSSSVAPLVSCQSLHLPPMSATFWGMKQRNPIPSTSHSHILQDTSVHVCVRPVHVACFEILPQAMLFITVLTAG
jgi:hypothetical protein